MTLDFFEQLRRNVERFPDRVAMQAITDAGRETFTYRQIAGEVRKTGEFLARAGVRSGDAAGILMESHPRWGMSFLAIQSAGGVVVPLDILHDKETLAGLIEHSGCRFLIVSRRLLPTLESVQGLLAQPLPYLVAGEAPMEEGEGPLPLVQRSLDDVLMILYTSGTTGNPKGVVLTGRNVYRNVVEALKMVGPTPEDHFLSVLPMYHVLALVINFILPLYLGARTTFLQSLEAQRILKAFAEEGITIFICVPQFFYLVHRRIMQEVGRQGALKRFLFRRLLAVSRFSNLHLGFNPGRFFFRAIHAKFGPSFRLFGVGGARFESEVAESFRDMGFGLAQAFGMTETAALITVAVQKGRAVGTAGVALPHDEVRIAAPDENGIGEVLVRGENVMLGYYKNPEATAEAIRDGWLYTGDLGYIDRRGYLHITGRKKDVIVLSSGKNIYPEEIEKFYQSNSSYIKEICVVGIPEGEGEKLHAVVVPDFDGLKSDLAASAYDSIRWELETLSERLPSYKRVFSLEIRREPLPLTTTRKVKRYEVQREVLERTGKPAAALEATPPETPLEERLFALIRAVKDAPVINRSMNLELDLGLTSLERVELVSAIQDAFGARIPDEEAAKIHTVAELASSVERLQPGDEAGAGGALVSWAEILRAPLDDEDARIAREILSHRPVTEAVAKGLGKMVHLASCVLFRLRAEGLKNLPEAPYMLCPNHASFLDGLLVFVVLPSGVLRNLFFIGDRVYFRGPVMSRIARWLKIVAVGADRGVRSTLRLAAEGLSRGMILCVFPEGERSIDGKLKIFRGGPSIVATQFGVPVVPVAIRGTYEVWHRGSSRIRLHPVTIVFGKPLDPSGKAVDAFTAELREAVGKLL